jgi:hypothetical protein
MFKEQTITVTPTFDTIKVQMIHTEATSAAKAAVATLLDKWNQQTGGNQYGEPMYCGFAWVDIKERSNSKLGKALKSIGFSSSHRSGVLQLWDPAQHRGQSMDCKEAGAMAYAGVWNNYGVNMSWGSRAD